MLKHVILVLICSISLVGYTQEQKTLSNTSEVSVITYGPGDALYEKFGHSAIRIKDDKKGLDLLYNYGVYDFDSANFYVNFTRGFMKYKLASYPFYYAVRSTQKEGRWMKQQVLNISLNQKNEFYNLLEDNLLPENSGYLYDPFFNNCSTKLRDIINTILGEQINWKDTSSANQSLRQLMNIEINQNTWGSLGINTALGNRLDKKASQQEYMYLPDYVLSALALATITKDETKEKLIKETVDIVRFKEKPFKSDAISPFLIFSILFLVVLVITIKDYKRQKRSKWLDFSLFFFSGLFGILILFLWFFTNHSTAPYNFNILWAFPLNIIVSVYLLKEKQHKWIATYLKLILLLIVLIPLVWLTGIQLFNWTLTPFFIAITVRYFFLQKTLNS